MPVASENQGTSRRSIRLVIADRHPIVLHGLMSAFASQRDFEIVASCTSGSSFVAAVRKLAPDIALFSDTLPDLTASEIFTTAKAEKLSTQLVLFTGSEKEDDLAGAVASGACTAISKCASPETLLRSLRLMTERTGLSPDPSPDLAPNGGEPEAAKFEKMMAMLTDREREIMRLVSGGLSNREIARQLNVSQGTVKVHLHNIFEKLEINNRTVLATIALLQRPVGFGTLSLAALAFATMSDVKASDTDNTFLHDGIAYKDLGHGVFEHGIFEAWTKGAVLRHIDIFDPVETAAFIEKDSSIGVSHATNPAVRMEELRVTQQAVLPNFATGYGPIGSGTLVATSTLAATAVGNLANAFMAVASPTKSRIGYGTFTMTAAGAWIYMVDNSNAAVQTLGLGQTLTDTFSVATLDSTTQAVTTTIHRASDADPNDLGNKAPGPAGHETELPVAFGTLGPHMAAGVGNAGEAMKLGGGDAIYGAIGSDTVNGNNCNNTIIAGHGGDQRTGSKSDDVFVYLSAIDSNSTRFDTITEFVSGSDKINLAAFGVLAFLHLTPSGTSVPPHTLAWIYNPASNETVVYVNPTADSLDIGDIGLVEIHLQGIVSVVESDFVYKPDAAAIAAASKGIDPALLVTTASDGTILTTGSVQASIDAAVNESSPVTADIWTMPADDGWRFHFGGHQIDSIASIKLGVFGDDPAYAGEASDQDGVTTPAHVSSIEPASSHATILTEEQLTSEPTPAGADAATTGHGKGHAAAAIDAPELGSITQNAPIDSAGPTIVEPNVTTGNGGGHGNSHHPSNAATAKTAATAELAEPDHSTGNGGGHGNSHHPSNPATAKTAATAEPTEPDHSTGNGGGHGNSHHPSNPATAKTPSTAELTEPDHTTGKGGGHGNSHHNSGEQTFHFNNQVAASNNAAVTPEELGDQHVLLGHGAALASIRDVGASAEEEHAANHHNDGQHHAMGHSPHELLV